jgi:shikimate dehydrogenase
LVATPTVMAFWPNLDAGAPEWDGSSRERSALMLGAGGAARAVAVGLAERGFGQVLVGNRTLARAEDLCAACRPHFPKTAFQPVPWDDLSSWLSHVTLLVNTTSLGMTGQPPLTMSLDGLTIHAVVNDLVYAPLETDLLRVARQRGNRVVDGLGMLLHQAVPGFERWFGVRPDVDDALREAVLKP